MKNRLHQLAAAAVLSIASLSAHAAFDLTINYTGPSQYQSYFTAAENFWESVITGYKPTVTLTGFTITATIENIDGQWGTLGSAGPDTITSKSGTWYTKTASMRFDLADMAYMTSSGTFGDVIRHEMGHTIGIGTLWGYNGLYVDGSGQYTGANALAQYKTEFNQPSATFVPVELGGGPGTAGGHWNEVDNGSGLTGITDSQGRDMRNELMTGWLNAPTFVSKTTVASLQDLGYTVNMNAVPEPETYALFALGLPVLLRFGKRRKSAAA
ncbi:MAG TPA: PEP-CTERM sorting domain-containing protein [Burkholderiaceae bacterium]|nr:PEP-CTERM sorting domain-containing protein [Burkholderiaceae bacterium]HMX11332.1 PEP-CTERM sorting domain-containing protein [Burkholderiaceae bacterium]HMY98996.1 PEP-CTERM sorting domain-containing protein [Burkholderiaceae bacterium]HNB45803.1 PEP-CTERM sorting domain-containing protein [Burkholderiaceae bacterium]HNG78768.1 PEP-CTERM sorting domain-containing protein [Burkholderiaceae bacterium]